MNLLKYTKEEIERRVKEHELRPENIKHFDICKALASGMKQDKIAEKFDVPDIRHIRYIKEKKCPEC